MVIRQQYQSFFTQLGNLVSKSVKSITFGGILELRQSRFHWLVKLVICHLVGFGIDQGLSEFIRVGRE
jgi:hypothetical protein